MFDRVFSKPLALSWNLTLSWRRSLSYRKQSNDLLCISVDWFRYNRDLRHKRVNKYREPTQLQVHLSMYDILVNARRNYWYIIHFCFESENDLFSESFTHVWKKKVFSNISGNSKTVEENYFLDQLWMDHCIKSVRIWSCSWPNAGKYGPE